MNPYHPHCYHDCHPVAAIPEPATWLLILIGLAGLILWSRRAKR